MWSQVLPIFKSKESKNLAWIGVHFGVSKIYLSFIFQMANPLLCLLPLPPCQLTKQRSPAGPGKLVRTFIISSFNQLQEAYFGFHSLGHSLVAKGIRPPGFNNFGIWVCCHNFSDIGRGDLAHKIFQQRLFCLSGLRWTFLKHGSKDTDFLELSV